MFQKVKAKAKALLAIPVIAVLLLSGCLIPEKFDAKIVINKDGSYTFTYDGTLANGLVLMAAAQGGKISAKEEAGFNEETKGEMAREPGFKKIDYLGNGRYKVLFEKSGKAGQPYYFLDKESKIFSIVPQKDGSISVSAERPDKKAIRELNSLGVKIDGTLTVSVASGVKVIKHNAQSQPTFFGLFGDYSWQIKSPDENPFIVVQPAL